MRLIGESTPVDSLQLIKVKFSHDMINCILAVIHPPEDDIDDSGSKIFQNPSQHLSMKLLQSNVAGFLWVVQIDMEQDTIVVLSPCPGALPSNYLLVGSLKWVE
jgi:polyribonucleotide 5'-hydroxyl-kinase